MDAPARPQRASKQQRNNDSEGRTIWIADAYRGDGMRFVVRTGEKLAAFMELELPIRRVT
jgi:hypothetical protein